MNRITVRLFAGGLIAILLLVAGSAIFIWFKISGLKEQVGSSLEKALGAKVEITSLTVDAWNERIEASEITLANQRPDAPWDRGEIGQAVAKFKWRDLFDSPIPLSVEISSWKLVLHSSGLVNPTPESSMATEGNSSPSRNAIQVTQISAHDGEVEIDLSGDKKIIIHQAAFVEANCLISY